MKVELAPGIYSIQGQARHSTPPYPKSARVFGIPFYLQSVGTGYGIAIYYTDAAGNSWRTSYFVSDDIDQAFYIYTLLTGSVNGNHITPTMGDYFNYTLRPNLYQKS